MSGEQEYQFVFESLARVHPVELHDYDPERFWEFFRRECPEVPRVEMEQMLAV